MEARFKPSRLEGTIQAPQSKSIAIRLLFSSLLGHIDLKGLEQSDDVGAAIRTVEALGVKHIGDGFEAAELPKDLGTLDISGSGTTLRMLIPILACTGISARLTGEETLRGRPLGVIHEYLTSNGVQITDDHLPLSVSGKLETDKIVISGSQSSQYISGFIFGLLLAGGGKIVILPPVRSTSYINMTCEVLNSLGASISYSGNEIHVKPLSRKLSYSGTVPGDFLLSSFYAIGAVLTDGKVKIGNLVHPEWSRGDSRIVDIVNRCAGKGSVSDGTWIARAGNRISTFREEVEDTPDMAVSLAALAAGSTGESGISGIELLGIKESDRIKSITDTLKEYGCKVRSNSMIAIRGTENPSAGTTEVWNDHRIAMLGSILSLRAGGTVKGAESVSKSNPRFFDDLRKLGGELELE